MAAIPGLMGTAGGASGSGFATPQYAAIAGPTGVAQANTAYTGVQNSLQAQQGLLTALQGQNGLTNQSNVYGQLQGVASGQGPNPAQAMLNQSTGQNVSNQAALMAGQRGASSNVGLMARQAAQQGAATQQQAVGQGASMQAQQSLNALGAAGNMATTQAQQQIGQTNANNQAQQSEQANLLNAIAGQNNAQVGMQSNINSANAALAGNAMQGQQAVIGGLLNGMSSSSSMMSGGGGGGGMGAMMGAEGGDVEEDSVTPPSEGVPSDPSGIDPAGSAGTAGSQKLYQSIKDIPKTIMKFAAMADGGITPGAYVSPTAGPQSMFGQYLAGVGNPGSPNVASVDMTSGNSGAKELQKGTAAATKSLNTKKAPQKTAMAGGPQDSTSRSMTSPGAELGPDMSTQIAYRGGNIESKLRSGGHVPGNPKVGGATNSYQNDTVKALLSPGEIVIPRSVTQSSDPVGGAAKFVQAVLAKKGKR